MPNEIIRIYYNPRCSKCRDALAIIEEQGYKTELIKYLETPPDKEELRAILKLLNIKPLALIRQGESVFKENFSEKNLSDEAWLDVMLQYPVLIERPIVIRGNKAIVARPAEKVREIL